LDGLQDDADFEDEGHVLKENLPGPACDARFYRMSKPIVRDLFSALTAMISGY
jgi:hypothetical protein